LKRLSRKEYKYVREVLDSEFRGSKKTSMVRQAEIAFADLIGSKFAIGFVNGTSTLHIALEVLGIGPGDEVIVPPLTMAATTMAVLHTGATPVFADVDRETFQISPTSIGKLVSGRTKAIITVALYGGSPDYASINKVAPNIPIVEDNAEAIGTMYQKRQIGTYGIMSSYSFQSSKHLTAGEGGMLCTNDESIANKIRNLQSLGYGLVGAKTQKIDKEALQSPSFERHTSLGWNYRMSEVTAAVVLGQIQNSARLIKRRIDIGTNIFELSERFRIVKSQGIYPDSTHSFWAAPLVLVSEDIRWEEFTKKFRTNGGKGIYAAWLLTYQEPFWKNKVLQNRLLDKQSGYQMEYDCPNAEYLQKRILAFRTNEWDKVDGKSQIKALEKTLLGLEKR